MINDEYASEQLIEHFEKRYGKVTDMFYINYSAQRILEMFTQLRDSVKTDELAEFELEMSKTKSESSLLDPENPVFQDLLEMTKDTLKYQAEMKN